MDTRTFAGQDLSALMLGTVQFGLPYGVANQHGQPEYRDVLKIIEAAIEGGINCFDTASMYGTSEEVLGRAVRELGVLEEVMIVTKARTFTAEERNDPDVAGPAIVEGVERSRRRLGLDRLPLVLVHDERDARYLDVLVGLKERGWIEHVGVSCDNPPHGAGRFVRDERVEAMQIPANLFDLRHRRAGSFDNAADQGKAVFVRSVFLQGLLTMPERRIPDDLAGIVPTRRALQQLAETHDMPLAELAVRYTLSLRGVTCVILGVDTADQLRENLRMIEQGPLPADLLAEAESLVPALDEYLVTPKQWPTAM